MTELEKMQRAHMYIMKLAEGIDPLSDRELPEDSALNQVRLSRCFFYVGDVLRQVIDNGGQVKRAAAKKSKEDFVITPEELGAVQVFEGPVGITQLCKRVSEASSQPDARLKVTLVTEWLVAKGFLTIETVHDSRRKTPTKLGEELGIYDETRKNFSGAAYTATLYTPAAQQFILDNLPSILEERDSADEAPDPADDSNTGK